MLVISYSPKLDHTRPFKRFYRNEVQKPRVILENDEELYFEKNREEIAPENVYNFYKELALEMLGGVYHIVGKETGIIGSFKVKGRDLIMDQVVLIGSDVEGETKAIVMSDITLYIKR